MRLLISGARRSCPLVTPLASSLRLSNASSPPSPIPVATLFFKDIRSKLLDLAREQPEATLAFFAPEVAQSGNLDASVCVIFVMAVFTVGVGSLWSGYTKHYL